MPPFHIGWNIVVTIKKFDKFYTFIYKKKLKNIKNKKIIEDLKIKTKKLYISVLLSKTVNVSYKIIGELNQG